LIKEELVYKSYLIPPTSLQDRMLSDFSSSYFEGLFCHGTLAKKFEKWVIQKWVPFLFYPTQCLHLESK